MPLLLKPKQTSLLFLFSFFLSRDPWKIPSSLSDEFSELSLWASQHMPLIHRYYLLHAENCPLRGTPSLFYRKRSQGLLVASTHLDMLWGARQCAKPVHVINHLTFRSKFWSNRGRYYHSLILQKRRKELGDIQWFVWRHFGKAVNLHVSNSKTCGSFLPLLFSWQVKGGAFSVPFSVTEWIGSLHTLA